MSRTSFPLSKARTKFYRLGSAWTWRIITFSAEGYEYRILVAYRTDREQFFAMLGVTDSVGDTKLVARLEFHGTHGGWHLHYASDEMATVPAGVRSGPWVKKYDCSKQGKFGLPHGSDDEAKSKAMTIVADVFRLRVGGAMI